MIYNYTCFSKKPKKAIICLHGWTGNEFSMEPVAKAMNLPFTSWIMPRAPYNIKSKLNEKRGENYSWSSKSVRKKNAPQKKDIIKSIFILNECLKVLKDKSFKEKDIFILGFSQGAILGLWFTINQKISLGGCISISGGLDKPKSFIENILNSNMTPILLLHGSKDVLSPLSESKNTLKTLKDYGFLVKLHIFQAGHKIPLIAKDIIWEFLNDKD